MVILIMCVFCVIVAVMCGIIASVFIDDRKVYEQHGHAMRFVQKRRTWLQRRKWKMIVETLLL